ncbi:MAG TPA: hypothetical protein VLM89_08875 [Phycisphaerae bacterium]|nr:hypothetical protein [Phycisphaerae bacterium]
MTGQPMSDLRTTSPDASPAPPVASAAHPIMFWVLTGLALAIFAPCVLVPLWVEKEQLREYERCLGTLVAHLEAQSARNQTRSNALLRDPQVNERIIRRELNYHPDGERVIEWSPDELAVRSLDVEVPATQPASAAGQVENSSRLVAVLARWLPDWPYRDLFAKSPQRPLLLAMAGGLLLAAFLLYAPSPVSEPLADQA